MNKRPSQQESEEDILRLQREFYNSKSAPAAKLVKTTAGVKSETSDDIHGQEQGSRQDVVDLKKGSFTKSRFKKSRLVGGTSQKFTIPEERLWEEEKKTVGSARVILQGIVQDVQERDQQIHKESPRLSFSGGFPSAFKIDRDVVKMGTEGSKGMSLFAQQFQAGKVSSIGLIEGNLNVVSSTSSASIPPTNSDVCTEMEREDIEMATKSDNSDAIHQENALRIKGMSESEIMEEQKQLKEMLGGNMIEFLKTRKTVKAVTPEHSTTNSKTSMEIDSSASDANHLKKVLGIDNDVIHMDNAEKDKLKWMENVDHCEKSEKASSARFDFEGNLVPSSADIPFDQGLHHHGNEPHAAGYSLDELFHLARSSFLKQRVFALTTLARLLEKRHSKSTKDHLNVDLIPVLCDAGLPFLLRWAIDDEIEAVYGAALYCLRALLVSYTDEVVTKQIITLPFGINIPSLCPIETRIKKNTDNTKKIGNTTIKDADMVKVDVIKGLLQMQLVERMTYILTTCSPLLPIVEDIISILIRISQHSKESAYQLAMNKRLINCIVTLLPLSSHYGDIDANMRLPFPTSLPLAMRLLCCLSIASRSTALMMVSDYDIAKRISCYVATLSSNFTIICQSHLTMDLVINCFSIWQILVGYGLLVDLLSELHPIVMSLLQLVHKSSNTDVCKEQINRIQYSICSLLSAHWCFISKSTHPKNALPKSTVNALQSFHPIMLFQMRSATEDYTQGNATNSYPLAFMMGYFSNYIKGLSKVNVSVDVLLSAIESLLTSDISILLSSKHIQDHFNQLSQQSELLYKQPLPNFKPIDALRTYGTDTLPNCNTLTNASNSPHILFCGLATVIYTACSIHKGVPEQFVNLFNIEGVKNYLKAISSSKNAAKNASEILSCRVELHGIVSLLQIFTKILPFVNKDVTLLRLCHEAAFKIFAILPCGMEEQAVHLMSNVLFTPEIFAAIFESSDAISHELSHLNISSSDQNNMKSTFEIVEKYMKEEFTMVTRTYYDACVRHMALQGIGVNTRLKDNQIQSQLLEAIESPIVPIDWIFLPILEIYSEASRNETIGVTVAEHTPQTTRIATSSLMFLLLLELWEYEAVTSLTITTRLTRVLSTFLVGTNLFLEETVHCALDCLLRLCTSDKNLMAFNFEEQIPGIPSFYDLYLSLLQRYISSSYCDRVFANFVLLPLGVSHSMKYRQAIWGEFSDIFRVFPLKVNEVAFDVSYLFSPIEDLRLLKLYFENLTRSRVRCEWSPLFYVIAVHHLNCFIFQNNSEVWVKQSSEDKRLLDLILTMENKSIKEDIIYYETVDASNSKGYRKFVNLPPTRQLRLREIQDS